VDWRLADAQHRLGELIDLALAEGPQRVHRQGDSAVVLAQRDYDRLTGNKPTFKQFLLARGPSLAGVELRRDRSRMRNTEL
jgi:hypothetical protein